MSYIGKCDSCGNFRTIAGFGPYGFRAICQACGAITELDDLLEPVIINGISEVAAAAG